MWDTLIVTTKTENDIKHRVHQVYDKLLDVSQHFFYILETLSCVVSALRPNVALLCCARNMPYNYLGS